MDVSALLYDFANVAHSALLIVSSEGDIRHVNPAAAELFGYRPEEMLGQPITIIIPERLRGSHSRGMNRVVEGEQAKFGGKPVEVHALKKDGTEFSIEITLSVWRTGGQVWAGATIRDITERRKRDAQLLRLATHDTLTGLQNKPAFMELVAEELQVQSVALFLIDLDGFREINDVYGQLIADSLIQAVAIRLSYLVDEGVKLARLGGDEFAVLARYPADTLEVLDFAEKLTGAFRTSFNLGGMDFRLSASCGVAVSGQHGEEADTLLASADFALQHVKERGGRGYLVFDEDMRRESTRVRAVRDELRHALINSELRMFYQPQFCLIERRLVGFEALLRWQHPTRGLLTPAHFLPALERSIIALDIGWWTLDEACKMAARMKDCGDGYKMAVNLFPIQFRSPELCAHVRAALSRYNLEPALLELELTEQTALDDADGAVRTLRDLQELGVGLAFDDFGTGYASLSSLQKLPLTTLKIDKSFVQHIHEKPSDAAISAALILMSNELGLKTVAEGIESEEQAKTLCQIGCHVGQGFLFGRPMEEEAALRLVPGARAAGAAA